MKCIPFKADYPIRIKFKNGEVIHGGSEFTTYNGRKMVRLACDHSPYFFTGSLTSLIKKPNTEKITCKRCLKVLGMLDEQESTKHNIRYLIYNKDGLFLNVSNGPINRWVENPEEATLYKTYKGVKESLYENCAELKYFLDGKEVAESCYLEAKRSIRHGKYAYKNTHQVFNTKKVIHEKFTIKEVELRLIVK